MNPAPEAVGRPEKPLRTWRPIVLWSAGILLALGLAWFVGAIVVPVWQVNRALAKPDPQKGFWIIQDEATFVHHFGGRARVISRMELYIGMPRFVARHRHTAAICLGYGGQEALPAIRKALASSAPEVRAGARRALVHLLEESKDLSLVPLVLDGLLDDSIGVRWEGAQSLGWLAHSMPEVVPEIDKLMAHERFEVRSAAAAARWKATEDGRRPLAALLAALEDEDPAVRLDAARILSALGPDAEAALPALERAARDADPKVRNAVEYAHRECSAGIHLLMERDADLDPVFLKMADDNWEVRARTALLLERAHAIYRTDIVDDAVATLRRALDDENQCVSDCAAYALRSFKPEQLAPRGPMVIEMDYDLDGKKIDYQLERWCRVSGEDALRELLSKKVTRRGELAVRLAFSSKHPCVLKQELDAAVAACENAGATVCEAPKLAESDREFAVYARTDGRSAELLLRVVGVRNGLIQYRLNGQLAEGEDGLTQALHEFSERTDREKGGPTAIDVRVEYALGMQLSDDEWQSMWQRTQESLPYFRTGWREGGGRKPRTVPGPDGKPIPATLSVAVRVVSPYENGSRYEIEGATFDGEAALSDELKRRLAAFRAGKEGAGRFTLSVRLQVEVGPGVTVTEEQMATARKAVADSGVGVPKPDGDKK